MRFSFDGITSIAPCSQIISLIEGAFFYQYFNYELGEGTAQELEGRIVQAQKSLVNKAPKYSVCAQELARQQAILAKKYHGWLDGRLEAQSASGTHHQSAS